MLLSGTASTFMLQIRLCFIQGCYSAFELSRFFSHFTRLARHLNPFQEQLDTMRATTTTLLLATASLATAFSNTYPILAFSSSPCVLSSRLPALPWLQSVLARTAVGSTRPMNVDTTQPGYLHPPWMYCHPSLVTRAPTHSPRPPQTATCEVVKTRVGR